MRGRAVIRNKGEMSRREISLSGKAEFSAPHRIAATNPGNSLPDHRLGVRPLYLYFFFLRIAPLTPPAHVEYLSIRGDIANLPGAVLIRGRLMRRLNSNTALQVGRSDGTYKMTTS